MHLDFIFCNEPGTAVRYVRCRYVIINDGWHIHVLIEHRRANCNNICRTQMSRIYAQSCIEVLLTALFSSAADMVIGVYSMPSRPSVACQLYKTATKQLNEWYFLSVCPSVTPFSLCSHLCIIMEFSGIITNDQGKVHAKGQGHRSKVKVTEVTTNLTVSEL